MIRHLIIKGTLPVTQILTPGILFPLFAGLVPEPTGQVEEAQEDDKRVPDTWYVGIESPDFPIERNLIIFQIIF